MEADHTLRKHVYLFHIFSNEGEMCRMFYKYFIKAEMNADWFYYFIKICADKKCMKFLLDKYGLYMRMLATRVLQILSTGDETNNDNATKAFKQRLLIAFLIVYLKYSIKSSDRVQCDLIPMNYVLLTDLKRPQYSKIQNYVRYCQEATMRRKKASRNWWRRNCQGVCMLNGLGLLYGNRRRRITTIAMQIIVEYNNYHKVFTTGHTRFLSIQYRRRITSKRRCDWCRSLCKPNTKNTCRGCKLMYYCGKHCQKKDWKKTHKFYCTPNFLLKR